MNEPPDSQLAIETAASANSDTLTLTLHCKLDASTIDTFCDDPVAHGRRCRHLHLDLTQITHCDNGSLSITATSESVQRTLQLSKSLQWLLKS